jgi:hypothetical protein
MLAAMSIAIKYAIANPAVLNKNNMIKPITTPNIIAPSILKSTFKFCFTAF